METYIITYENGKHFKSDKITVDDMDAVYEGVITVIRCSDQKELLPTGEWEDLPKWV
jgi:hypothetical protein